MSSLFVMKGSDFNIVRCGKSRENHAIAGFVVLLGAILILPLSEGGSDPRQTSLHEGNLLHDAGAWYATGSTLSDLGSPFSSGGSFTSPDLHSLPDTTAEKGIYRSGKSDLTVHVISRARFSPQNSAPDSLHTPDESFSERLDTLAQAFRWQVDAEDSYLPAKEIREETQTPDKSWGATGSRELAGGGWSGSVALPPVSPAALSAGGRGVSCASYSSGDVPDGRNLQDSWTISRMYHSIRQGYAHPEGEVAYDTRLLSDPSLRSFVPTPHVILSFSFLFSGEKPPKVFSPGAFSRHASQSTNLNHDQGGAHVSHIV